LNRQQPHTTAERGRKHGSRVLVLGIALMSVAIAEGQVDRAAAIESRVAGFRDMGSAFKNFGDELEVDRPDAAELVSAAEVIAGYAPYIRNWFPEGTEPRVEPEQGWFEWLFDWFSADEDYAFVEGVESHAKNEIWLERDRFNQAATEFEALAERMLLVTGNGDLHKINAQYRELHKSCSGCHDVFREELD
jgi:cytochrome c556